MIEGNPLFVTFIQDIIQGVFLVAGAAIASGWVTAAITQVLKIRAIRIPAEKYPVPVAIVLSLATSAGAVYVTGLVDLVGWVSWIIMAVATLYVATQSYDVVKNAVAQIKHPDTAASTAPHADETRIPPPGPGPS